MKILHVIASLDERTGGPLRTTIDFSAASVNYGLTSEIVGVGPISIAENNVGADKIHSVPLNVRSYWYSNKLTSWLKDNVSRFDGVIIHGAWLHPSWASAEVCQSQKVPYAVFPHGLFDYWPVRGQGWLKTIKKLAYWQWRERRIVETAECILYTTKREQINSERALNIACRKQIIVPYGLTSKHLSPERPQNPALVLAGNLKVALFLSRLHPKKNISFLIHTWSKAQLPENWKLVIAGTGDPSYIRSLTDLVGRLGLENHVIFTGHVAGKDKAYLFQRSDWFLLPSLQENFGVAAFEALSYGCPIAISDEVYLAELLHADSEILPLREDCWVDFLRTRMIDEVRRQKLLESDRANLHRYFDAAALTRDWVKSIEYAFSNGG